MQSRRRLETVLPFGHAVKLLTIKKKYILICIHTMRTPPITEEENCTRIELNRFNVIRPDPETIESVILENRISLIRQATRAEAQIAGMRLDMMPNHDKKIAASIWSVVRSMPNASPENIRKLTLEICRLYRIDTAAISEHSATELIALLNEAIAEDHVKVIPEVSYEAKKVFRVVSTRVHETPHWDTDALALQDIAEEKIDHSKSCLVRRLLNEFIGAGQGRTPEELKAALKNEGAFSYYGRRGHLFDMPSSPLSDLIANTNRGTLGKVDLQITKRGDKKQGIYVLARRDGTTHVVNPLLWDKMDEVDPLTLHGGIAWLISENRRLKSKLVKSK